MKKSEGPNRFTTAHQGKKILKYPQLLVKIPSQPFSTHFKNSPNFSGTLTAVLAVKTRKEQRQEGQGVTFHQNLTKLQLHVGCAYCWNSMEKTPYKKFTVFRNLKTLLGTQLLRTSPGRRCSNGIRERQRRVTTGKNNYCETEICFHRN